MLLVAPDVTPEDKAWAGIALHQFGMLDSYLTEFEAALNLFMETANERGPRRHYAMIAARGGGITIWNFLHSLKSILTCVESSSVLRKIISVKQLKQAQSTLFGSLPHDDIKAIRDSIAHASEIIKHPKAWAHNATPAGIYGSVTLAAGGNFLGLSFHGHRITTTGYDGHVASYTLSADTLRLLLSVLGEAALAIGVPSTPEQQK